MQATSARSDGGSLAGAKELVDKVGCQTSIAENQHIQPCLLPQVLIADFFFILLVLAWLAAGVGERAALGSSVRLQPIASPTPAPPTPTDAPRCMVSAVGPCLSASDWRAYAGSGVCAVVCAIGHVDNANPRQQIVSGTVGWLKNRSSS